VSGILSICIPSFCRTDALEESLGSLLRACENINEIEEIIFVDDGYDQNFSSYIIDKYKIFKKFRYHKNPVSGSFGAVYVECLSVAASEYILVTNDDDILFPEGIMACLTNFQNLSQTGLIVPVWLSSVNRVIRGHRGKGNKIYANNILKYTAHAPGLIFKKSVVDENIVAIRERLSANCTFTMMYPQVLLSGLVLDKGFSIFSLGITIGKDGHSLPTQIVLSNGDTYYSLKARVLQYYSLLDIETQKLLSQDVQSALCWNFLARIILNQKRKILLSIMSFLIRRSFISLYRNLKFSIYKKINKKA
jgi:hypothetical protein